MTISSEICTVSYLGDGVETVWTYDYLIPVNPAGDTWVEVSLTALDGSITVIPSSDYSITGVGNPSGGNVTYPLAGPPLANDGTILTITRAVPIIQTTAISNQSFYPHTLEQLCDYITMWGQQLSLTHGSGGSGGVVNWTAILGKPDVVTAIQGLTPAAGKIIEYTSATTAHMINTPGGGGGGVTSVNGLTGAVTIGYAQIADFGAGVNHFLAGGTGISLAYDAGTKVTTITATGGGGGDMEPPLLNFFGMVNGDGTSTTDNDLTLTVAVANADFNVIYMPDVTAGGTQAGFATGNAITDLATLGFVGRGIISLGTNPATAQALPAKFAYMDAKPYTWPNQGNNGWFRGDQFFTDGGEYKIIGPLVRTYDLTSRYFESNTIPHHAWFDVNSGNSGGQANLTSGANPGMGTSIPVQGGGIAEWVGKTVGFWSGYGGTLVESKTITGVTGTTISIDSPLTGTYVWNPGGGSFPVIAFSGRTWAGMHYIRVNCLGGGDQYGHAVRLQMGYQPKPGEVHPFMTATGGQYGGSVDWLPNTSGTYCTGWESQYSSHANDVSAVAQVDSFNRDQDLSLNLGRFWIGTFFQSGGARPVDACHVVTGRYRNGLDTALGSFYETSALVDPTLSSGAVMKVFSTNGAHLGDPVTVGELGATLYTGTITGINAGTGAIAVSPNLPPTIIGANTLVTFPKGGAAVQTALGQRWVLNSYSSLNGRGSSPIGQFASVYGNQQGDLIMQSDNDGVTDYWAVRFVRGATSTLPDSSRIRLRPNGFQVYGGQTIGGPAGSDGLAVAGNIGSTAGDISVADGHKIILGPNTWIQKSGATIIATINGGGSFVTLAS